MLNHILRIFLASLVFLCSLTASSFASYIKFGNGISSSDGEKGNIDNLDFGIYFINKFYLEVSLEPVYYSSGVYYR